MLINRIYNRISIKKNKFRTFWAWKVKTENYSNNDFYSYLQKNQLTHTCYINHTTLIRHQKVHLTCRELPSPCTAYGNLITIINMKRNFCRYQVSIFREKKQHFEAENLQNKNNQHHQSLSVLIKRH